MATVEQMQQVFGDTVASMGQTMVRVLQQQQLHWQLQEQKQQQPSGTPAQSAPNSAIDKQQLNARLR